MTVGSAIWLYTMTKPIRVVMRQVLEVVSAEQAVRFVPQVGLKRKMGQRAHQQRDKQAQDLVLEELSETALPQRIEQAGARDDEHQRHHEGGGEKNPRLHRGIQDVIRYIPAFQVVEAGGVEGKDEQDAQHPQPVEIVTAKLGIHIFFLSNWVRWVFIHSIQGVGSSFRQITRRRIGVSAKTQLQRQ